MRSPDALPALDSWTLVHIASGAALGALRVGPLWTLGLLVAFELAEGLARRARPDGRMGVFDPETRANIVGDLAAGVLGWALVRSL